MFPTKIEEKKLNQKLPTDILLALARYYRNRNAQRSATLKEQLPKISFAIAGSCTCISSDEQRKIDKDKQWNKDADLENISVPSRKHGFGYSASAGTFWFSKKWRHGVLTFAVNESNYLEHGIQEFKSENQETKLPVIKNWVPHPASVLETDN